MSVAVGLEAGEPARHIWRQHFASLSLSYFAAASTALCLVLIIQQVGILAVPIILPVLAQFQLTLRSSFGRLEDAKRHVAEMEHEIAERRQAEESLRTSERLNRTLVEHLPHRILVKDRNSTILFCNARYAEDVGRRPEDMVGRDALAFRPPGVGERDDTEDRDVMTHGTLMDIETPSLVGSQERWWHTVKVPYRDEHGTVIGIIIVSEDVTDRRTLEAAVSAGAEDGGHRPAGRRRGARLQQSADRRSSATASCCWPISTRTTPRAGGHRRNPEGGHERRRAHAPAAGVQPQADHRADAARPERGGRRHADRCSGA